MIYRIIKNVFSGINLAAGLVVSSLCFGMENNEQIMEPTSKAHMYYRDAYAFLEGQHPDRKLMAQNLLETALILNHPYAASALCKSIYKDKSQKEKALLKSIQYKSKNYVRDGFLQDVDMLLYAVKINETKEIFKIEKCGLIKYHETQQLKEIEYIESINPQLAIERYGYLSFKFDVEQDNEISNSALQALIRLSEEWPSCFIHLSLGCFKRERGDEALSFLEKAIRSATVEQEDWLEKCIYHANVYGYNNGKKSNSHNLSIKEQCWKILINNRNNVELPLEFRRKIAASIVLNHNFFNGEFYDQEKYAQINGSYSIQKGDFNIAGTMVQNYVAYISILKESKNNRIECHVSEIDNVFKHITFIDSIDIDKSYKYSENSCNFRKSSLLRYAQYYKNRLRLLYNMDINNPIWQSSSENFLDSYSGATEFYKGLEIESDDNLVINMHYHLYKRSEKLLLEDISGFVLYLCLTNDSRSLCDLYEVTSNPLFKSIVSFLQKPIVSYRGYNGQADILYNDDRLKTDFDYAPQYDVLLYNYDDILNVKSETEKDSFLNAQRKKIVQNILTKKENLIEGLSAQQQFDLAMDYDLIHSCLSSIHRPFNLIQDSYLTCLWLSVCKGHFPARQKLAHLYTKGDKKECAGMYMLLQQFHIPQDVCNVIMFKYMFIDWKQNIRKKSC